MPIYNILGLQIFIPDLNDLENAIVAPLEQVITSGLNTVVQNLSTALQSIVAGAIAAFNWVDNVVSPILNGVQTFIGNAVNQIINELSNISSTIMQDIQTALSGLAGAINSILPPIESFISNLIGGISSTIQSGLNAITNFLEGLGSQISSTLSSIGQTIVGAFTSGLSTLENYILGGLNDLKAFFSQVGSTIVQGLTSGLNQITNFLYNNVLVPIEQFFSQLGNVVQNGLNFLGTQINGFISFISSGLSSIGQDILNGLNQVYNALVGIITDVSHVIGNIGEFVVSGFNQLSTGLSGAFNAIGNALGTLWNDFIQALNTYVIQPILSGIHDVLNGISNVITNIQNAIKHAIISLLPRTPDDAFISALTVAEIGGLTFIAGEAISLALEAIYPTKHLGVPEALHKGLELLGLTEITAAFYSIIVDSGWGQQLRYFFNYNLQPRRIDVQTALRGLWYGVLSEEQVIEELKYEGYNDEAINAIIRTAYRPMPAFLLSRLLEMQVVSNDFALKQLQMLGFPPDMVNEILKGFQNLTLSGFQSNAKSLVYAMYKDGFINEDLARQILTVFAVPADQQNWILTLANYEFKYNQQIQLRTYVIDLFKRGEIHADDAVDLLTTIGMDKSRAEILVKIAGIVQAPPPPKSVREQILKEALALPLEVS